MSSSHSTFEILPDEVLLEVCRYLLCTDILHSFVGLNYRMTRMITQYRHYVSLHKTSILKFDYLSVYVLPNIGSQIRSLLIDRCYSVLQDELFINYFGKNMSVIFSKLERVSLVSYEYQQINAFLAILHDLPHLVEISLYGLFPIQRTDQSTLVRSIAQANNHRFTTVLIDDQSSCLNFDTTDRYLNILQLRVNLRTIGDLSSLFTTIPNIRHLDVVLQTKEGVFEYFDGMTLSPLLYLTHFRLKSIVRGWELEQLHTLLGHMPVVQHLSLFLTTSDIRFIDGDTILSLLPVTVQRLDYAICYFYDMFFEPTDEIVSSWPLTHPVTCFNQEKFFFLHTLPWNFGRIPFSKSIGKMMSSRTNSVTAYDTSVKQVDVTIDKTFTLTKSLPVISQCRRVREITVNMKHNGTSVKEEPLSISCLRRLSQLIQFCFHGSIPSDLNHFSFVLNAAPNLFRLDLPLDLLLRLIEDQSIRYLLGRRITSLSVFQSETKSPLVSLNGEHISLIASVFSRLCDLYVVVSHLPSITITVSNEDNHANSVTDNVTFQSSQQQNDSLISPLTSDSMVSHILAEFKKHRLIGLCVDGYFQEQLKTDTERWLRNNTILDDQRFQAVFNNQLNRLIIWM